MPSVSDILQLLLQAYPSISFTEIHRGCLTIRQSTATLLHTSDHPCFPLGKEIRHVAVHTPLARSLGSSPRLACLVSGQQRSRFEVDSFFFFSSFFLLLWSSNSLEKVLCFCSSSASLFRRPSNSSPYRAV